MNLREPRRPRESQCARESRRARAFQGPDPRERGSGTVIAIAIIGGVLAIGLALTAAVAGVAQRSYVQGVADIGALAAATSRSCAAASELLARQSAPGLVLSRCEFDGAHAQVEVAATGLGAHSATARAGPVW